MINTKIFYNHVISFLSGMNSLDLKELEAAKCVLLEAIKYDYNIFTCGNGASASIAQHMACDFTKGCFNAENNITPRVISLSDNIPLITAISNDISYDEVYSFQLNSLCYSEDVLFVISSSGNSPNIIRALETAKDKNLITIAMTGFDGGKARELADIKLHVDAPEYEATEDCHQAIMQILAKYLREELKNV